MGCFFFGFLHALVLTCVSYSTFMNIKQLGLIELKEVKMLRCLPRDWRNELVFQSGLGAQN